MAKQNTVCGHTNESHYGHGMCFKCWTASKKVHKHASRVSGKKPVERYKKPVYVWLTEEQVARNAVVRAFYKAWAPADGANQLYYDRIAGKFSTHKLQSSNDNSILDEGVYVFDVVKGEPQCEWDEFITIIMSRISSVPGRFGT